MDSREQFEMLSTVSNYHLLGFPSTQDPQKIKTPNISFQEHITTPEQQRYIPTSPCNRIMYFIKSGQLQHLKNYLKFLQLKDNIPEFQTDQPKRKKQCLTRRARRVDAFHLKQKYLSPELADMIWQSNIDRSLYTKFKNQLLTSGTIKWRYHQAGRNVCVSLRLRVQNAVPAQPCVGKIGISLVLLNFLHCNFRLWFETP